MLVAAFCPRRASFPGRDNGETKRKRRPVVVTKRLNSPSKSTPRWPLAPEVREWVEKAHRSTARGSFGCSEGGGRKRRAARGQRSGAASAVFRAFEVSATFPLISPIQSKTRPFPSQKLKQQLNLTWKQGKRRELSIPKSGESGLGGRVKGGESPGSNGDDGEQTVNFSAVDKTFRFLSRIL